jgi:surfactin synthase thioesterase subunit
MGDLVADDPDLRELALATIRTDLRVRGSYRYRPGPAIESDLHAVVGDADPMLTPPQLAGWAQHTAGAFGLSVVPGGHLLATVQRPGPVGVLTSILRPRTDPSARGPLWPARSI